MTNKELELIGQLTEVAMTVAELRSENKILKDINEKLIQSLRIHDVSWRSEERTSKQLCQFEQDERYSSSTCKYCGGNKWAHE